jgi:DNA polymerase-1
MKTFYIIDGNSFAYRAFYAMPPLTGPSGEEVHAVYGFYNMVMRIVKNKKPDYIALTFDHPKPTLRHKKYADYKIQREKMPESLQAQMKIIKDIALESNFAVYEQEGYEADDIIAAAAAEVSKTMLFMIASSDKDMMQLVNDRVNVFKYSKNEEVILDPGKIRELFGIEPVNVTDVLALMGDAADNIPGVDGIGEKTAYKLVVEFKNIDNLYKNLDKIKSEKQKERLKNGEGNARLSYELALLGADDGLLKTINFDIKACAVPLIDTQVLDGQFVNYNFKSLVSDKKIILKEARKEKSNAQDACNKEAKKEVRQEDEKAAQGEAEKAQQIGRFPAVKRLSNPGEIENMIKAPNELVILFDGDESTAEFVSIGSGEDYFYVYGPDFPAPDLSGKYVITNSAKTLYKICARPPEKVSDIMLLAYLINPEKSYHHYSLVFSEYLNAVYLSYEDITGRGVKRISADKIDGETAAGYVSSSLKAAVEADTALHAGIKDKGLENVYYDIEAPLTLVLADMEKTGLKIDSAYLDELIKKTAADIETLEKRIYREADGVFNINSPKQLGEVLFEKLNLPKQKKTKTGYSTDNEVLSALERYHPIVAEILKYRTLNKLKTGFLDAIKLKLTADEKLYPDYNQTVTATGRLSSSNPNIQNIPVRGEEGREIRKIFMPLKKNEKLLKADYSQIELRVLAHISGDVKLIEAFKNGADIHSITASEVFGTPPEFLNKDQRRVAKTINFGIVYGISAYGLAKQLSISNGEAADFIDKFFLTFPGVRDYQQITKKSAAEKGYVQTLTGRKRFMANINSANRNIREFAERAAINAPIQGTAADIIKIAMIHINEEFKKSGISAKMILQVHDELVFSVPVKELKMVEKIVKKNMECALKLDVPLTVAVGEGDNWYECG